MSFYPNQRDIEVLFQPSKQIYSKVEILNKDYKAISSIEGKLIDDSYNVDADSEVRRSYNCTLQVTNKTLVFDKNNEIWFDKYIRPYIGIYDVVDRKIRWYLKGTYSTLNATHAYEPETNTLSLTCNDLMCRLAGELDGKQTGLNFTIPTGQDIRTSIIGILKVFGFTKYKIESLPRRVQHDLQFGAGSTALQMIQALMEFCPNYEFFFDLDGTFVVQRIPCYTNDDDILSDVIIRRLLVSQDSYTVGFTAKNCIEVWGKSYDSNSVDRMAESCTYSSGTYTVTFGGDPLTSLADYLLFAVTVNNANAANCKMTIKDSKGTSFGTFVIYDEYDKKLKANTMQAGTTYLFCYDTEIENVPEVSMRLIGNYSSTATYLKNDVVMSNASGTMKTYIARPASGSTITGIAPTNTSNWKEIVFATEFALRGMYSSNATYQATEMVGYNGKLYYCLKNETKGLSPNPKNYNEDDPTWEEFNMNINEIKLGNKLRYRGHITAHGVYKNTSDSRFSIEGMGREYWEIFSGGEYDNITSDALAVERAMYECYYKANLNESLSLTLIDIPWLDVNKKISYTRMLNTEAERWMISSISSETSEGTCSVTLNKFYPDWSEVYQSGFGT